MNDEQLERELRAALLVDDPGTMPARLSGRVADVPDEVSAHRGLRSVRFLRFSPKLRALEALAAVVVVAVVIAAALGLRGSSAGPAGASSSSSAVPSSSTIETASPTAPSSADWTGLNWSAPAVIPDSIGIRAIVSWNGGLLAVGDVGGSGQAKVGFWSSTDGTAWARLAVNDATFADGEVLGLVATPTDLVAWGWVGQPTCTGQGEGEVCGPLPVMIWTSTDGVSWTPQLTDTAVFESATIRGIAYGPRGLVAVGDTGFNDPAIWLSNDGAFWAREFFKPVPKDWHYSSIQATASGYVVAGSIGGSAPVSGGVELPSTGVAAAWLVDGQGWTEATVNRANGVGTDLGGIAMGAQGMVAVGSATGGKGSSCAWTSTDGRTWQPIAIGGGYAGLPTPVPGAPALPAFTITGDGTRLVALGDDQSGLHIWTSSDGLAWQDLPFSGATDTISPAINQVVPVPGGLIVIATSSTSQQVTIWRVTALP